MVIDFLAYPVAQHSMYVSQRPMS